MVRPCVARGLSIDRYCGLATAAYVAEAPGVGGHVVAVNEAEIELGFRATSARRAVRNRAKLVASIDQVSQGRFLFSVGGGWNQDEIDMGLAHHRLSLTAQLQ